MTRAEAPALHHGRECLQVTGVSHGHQETPPMGQSNAAKRIIVVIAACVLRPRSGCRAGVDGSPHRHRQRRTGRRPFGRGRPRQLTGPDWRSEQTVTTNEKGQLRFPALPPGPYVLDIELAGICDLSRRDIRIGAGATIERTAVLKLAGLAESVSVEGAGSRLDARDSGFGTRFGPEDIEAIPTRRQNMFDLIRAAPGISPTSQGTHELSRVRVRLGRQREHVSHRRHELHRHQQRRRARRAGHRLHPGNTNPVGRGIRGVRRRPGRSVQRRHQAGKQPFSLRRVVLRADRRPDQPTGAARHWMRLNRRTGKAATSAPGTATSRRTSAVLLFAIACGSSRDTSICATTTVNQEPTRISRRTYEQDKVFAKLTWRLAPAWQLVQSVHDEFWVNPEVPTSVKPFDATQHQHASVPAITFGHLTHTSSANTVWDVRAGRYLFSQESSPSTGNRTTPSRTDVVTGVTSGAPQQVGAIEAGSHDRQGDLQPLSARAVARGSRVEGGRAVRQGRAPLASCRPDRRAIQRPQRARRRPCSSLPPTPAAGSSPLPRSPVTP